MGVACRQRQYHPWKNTRRSFLQEFRSSSSTWRRAHDFPTTTTYPGVNWHQSATTSLVLCPAHSRIVRKPARKRHLENDPSSDVLQLPVRRSVFWDSFSRITLMKTNVLDGNCLSHNRCRKHLGIWTHRFFTLRGQQKVWRPLSRIGVRGKCVEIAWCVFFNQQKNRRLYGRLVHLQGLKFNWRNWHTRCQRKFSS